MTAIRIIREPSDGGATLGSMYINDRWVCWTLEDVIREVAGVEVVAWKIPGKTAIPAGHYPVRLSMSNRFKVVLPEILNVPGFSGIRIHAGNTADNTEGCVLVGLDRKESSIMRSKLALEDVITKMGTGAAMFADIENPPRRHFAPHTMGQTVVA